MNNANLERSLAQETIKRLASFDDCLYLRSRVKPIQPPLTPSEKLAERASNLIEKICLWKAVNYAFHNSIEHFSTSVDSNVKHERTVLAEWIAKESISLAKASDALQLACVKMQNS